MLPELKKQDLENQGYRIAGNHSAIKVCMWTKKAIKGEDVCYKQSFYGISTSGCLQMTPSFCCNHRCCFFLCVIEFTPKEWIGEIDSPDIVLDKCIDEHRKFLIGFKGNKDAVPEKLQEAMNPVQVAISLSGEPTFYPKLPELVDEIKSRGMTAFLVTNGTNPVMLKKLIDHQPTQLYLTLPSPDKESYIKVCSPLTDDGWNLINQSLSLLKNFKRTVIRLTLVKGINMFSPEKYAEIINKYKPDFIEAKGYVWVGHSQDRLKKDNMPYHHEIQVFANEILKNLPDYVFQDEKKESRVVLLMKKGFQQFI